MTEQEGKDLSICETKKLAMPLVLERESTLPLQCNALQEDFDAYKKAIAKTIERNIELLKELPPPKNFTVEEIVAYFQKEIKKDLEQDKFFEKSVEVGKYATSMFESMRKYFAQIYDLNNAEKEKNSYDIFTISRLFLNSDLPDEFYKAISNSYLTENDFLDIFDRTIRKEYLMLVNCKANRTKFVRICDHHNTWVREFTDKINLIDKNRTKLIWYVDLNNSHTIDELFKDKFIKTEELDSEVLTQLISAVTEISDKLEELVLQNLRPCLPPTEVNDSMKAIAEMMDVINR